MIFCKNDNMLPLKHNTYKHLNRFYFYCKYIIIIALVFTQVKSIAQQNYFIDAVNGNDVNNGTSISTPGKTYLSCTT